MWSDEKQVILENFRRLLQLEECIYIQRWRGDRESKLMWAATDLILFSFFYVGISTDPYNKAKFGPIQLIEHDRNCSMLSDFSTGRGCVQIDIVQITRTHTQMNPENENSPSGTDSEGNLVERQDPMDLIPLIWNRLVLRHHLSFSRNSYLGFSLESYRGKVCCQIFRSHWFSVKFSEFIWEWSTSRISRSGKFT